MTRYLAIASGKGGVGKTITAINLASAMQAAGRHAILVDGNLDKPNVSIYLGTPINPVTLNHVLSGHESIINSVYEHASGIKVIPSEISPEHIHHTLHSLLQDALVPLSGHADYIIIDSPSGHGHAPNQVLRSADEALIVTTPDMASMVDSLRTIKHCKELGVTIAGVLVNRVRNNGHEIDTGNIGSFLGKPVISVIPEHDAIHESVAKNHPVVHSHPTSSPAVEYKKLASLFLGSDYVEAVQHSGIFSSIINRFRG